MIEWTMDGQRVTQRVMRDWEAKFGDRKYLKLTVRNVGKRWLVNLYAVARGPRAAMAEFKHGFFAREDWANDLSLGLLKPGETAAFIARLTATGDPGETPRITVEER